MLSVDFVNNQRDNDSSLNFELGHSRAQKSWTFLSLGDMAVVDQNRLLLFLSGSHAVS